MLYLIQATTRCIDFLFTVLPFKASCSGFARDIISGAMSYSGPVGTTPILVGILVRWRMHASDADTRHGARQVCVGRDTQTAGIWVQNVKVVSRETGLHHHGFQTVDKQLCSVTALCCLKYSMFCLSGRSTTIFALPVCFLKKYSFIHSCILHTPDSIQSISHICIFCS